MSAEPIRLSKNPDRQISEIFAKIYVWSFCLVCAIAFFYRAINAMSSSWIGSAAILADELAVLMAVGAVMYATTTTGRVSVWILYLLGIASISVILTAAVGDPRPWPSRLPQALIHLKLPLLLLITTWPGWQKHGRAPANFFLGIIVIISVLGILWNLLFPLHFENLFELNARTRLGMPRIGGLSLMPNDLAIVFVVVAFGHAYSIAGGLTKIHSGKTVAISLLLIFVVAITGSRAALTGCLLYFACIAILDRSIISAVILAFLLAGTGIVAAPFIVSMAELTSQNLQAFSDIEDTRYIRGIMIYYAFILANEHFPFGAGLASFGSVMSSGSITYTELNVATGYFFDNTRGIFDSNFASLLGELGYVLTAAVYIVIGLMIHSIGAKSVRRRSASLVSYALITFIFIASLAYPIFMYGPPAVALLFALSGGGKRDTSAG